ncbi:MAG: flagellar basal body L-ring protein [Ponticaulis sp.]|nr:flagellar basal body L-ring protein [Ponticaulis sp.]|tara:strand:+ start:34810 stop:35553 length:744 start_codon:yes stop_codon:yes gene_type:complete
MTRNSLTSSALLLLAVTGLGACSTVGSLVEEPQLTPISNPDTIIGAIPPTAPVPKTYSEPQAANSLWRVGARSFFKDQRASMVGDILTVDIDIADTATLSNTTSTSRTGAQDAEITGLFGLEAPIERALPGADSLGTGIGTSSSSTSQGVGSVNRTETIQLEVAAVITDVLPNGNFVIAGRQEVKVNAEVRELVVSGIIRPEDISAGNTIQHTQMAEARISYGGRGDISTIQRPRYGQRVANKILPF